MGNDHCDNTHDEDRGASSEDMVPFLGDLGDIPLDPDLVFVVLPFKNMLLFERVIKPAVEKAANLTCKTAADFFTTGSVMRDIAVGIRRAGLVIADLTGKNPNVFYELGLAHAFGKKVVLLTESDEDVPSDLRALRYYPYDVSSPQGIRNLEETLGDIVGRGFLAVPEHHEKRIWDISEDKGNAKTFSADFLKHTEGTFCLWAFLSEEQFGHQGWRTLLSHCGNDGLPKTVTIEIGGDDDQTEPATRKVLVNQFAIRFGYKNASHPTGVIGFFWSDAHGSGVQINGARDPEHDWHLLTVVWSKSRNFVKTYVNNRYQDGRDFRGWPEEILPQCLLGTWPGNARAQYANTRLGDIRFYRTAVEYEDIVRLWEPGPDTDAEQ